MTAAPSRASRIEKWSTDMGYSYEVVCDHHGEHCEPNDPVPVCYEIICGTCGFRFGEHYGATPAECPAEDSALDGAYREEDESKRRYWTDKPVPEKGHFVGASDADLAAITEILGVQFTHA